MTPDPCAGEERGSRLAVTFDCVYPLSTGGGERFYRALSESFARAGNQVDYLTRLQWAGPAPQMAGVEVRAISGRSELYDSVGTRRLPPAVGFAWGLFRYLVRRRSTYDAVLICATPVLNIFAARLALLGSGTRLCSDFLEVWRREQWLEYSGAVVGRVANFLQTLSIRVSPLASCHAQVTARRLVAAGLRTPPIVSPGLIHQTLDVKANLEVSEPPMVVFAGRHIPDKQVEAIPPAVAWARRELPGLLATILGEGQSREVVRAAVVRCGLSDVIDLPGFVSEPELEEAVRGAAVFVNPSRREGYGLVVVEACAAGTPVVVVDAEDNAAIELVENGVNGYVASSAAPEVLGAAIVAAVRGGGALRVRTRAWFEAAVQERTVEAVARQLLDRLLPPG